MPLNMPRKSDAWDGFRGMVAFPAESRDSGAPVGCAISAEALRDCFGAEIGNITSLMQAFRRSRPTIEAAASAKYDVQGKPSFVVLLSEDLAENERPRPPGLRTLGL